MSDNVPEIWELSYLHCLHYLLILPHPAHYLLLSHSVYFSYPQNPCMCPRYQRFSFSCVKKLVDLKMVISDNIPFSSYDCQNKKYLHGNTLIKSTKYFFPYSLAAAINQYRQQQEYKKSNNSDRCPKWPRTVFWYERNSHKCEWIDRRYLFITTTRFG